MTVAEFHARCDAIEHKIQPTFDELCTARASVVRAGIFRALVTAMKDIRAVAITLPETERLWMTDARIGINVGLLEALVEVEDARVNGTARQHVLAPAIEQSVGGILDRMAEIPADSITGLLDLFRELQAQATNGNPLAGAKPFLDHLVDRHEELERSAA